MRQIIYRTGRTPMLIKIAAGFFLGIIFGLVAAPMIPYYPVLGNNVIPFLGLAGTIFLRILAVIIVPLVFSSLITSVAATGDTKQVGRVGIKTLALFLITTIIAAGAGLLSAKLFKPGIGINIPASIRNHTDSLMQTRDLLMNILPENFLSSMFHTNMLQIIIAAVLIGILCIFLGDSGKKITRFFRKVTHIMQNVTYNVIRFAPFGVFALAVTAAVDFGLTLVAPFMKIIAAVYSGCIVHALLVYSLMVILFCKKSPKWFFSGIREAALTAYATRSSAATLPVTFADVQENLCVSQTISSFVLPLGATIHMDGTAIYEAVCAMFAASAFNVPITFELQMSIFTAAVIASIGTVGVPSGGMIMLTMVLTSAGLPVEAVGLVAGIDVVLGPARTCLNVVGDAAVCVSVASSEGENLTQHNSSGRMPIVKHGA